MPWIKWAYFMDTWQAMTVEEKRSIGMEFFECTIHFIDVEKHGEE
jgi:hypothetical protein